jgi:hypothetical protein
MTTTQVDERAYLAKMRRRNILISPLTIFVRMPIMLIGMGLVWVGDRICTLAEKIPGWHRA